MKVAFLLGSLNRGGTETMILNVLQNNNSSSFEKVLIYRKDGCLKDEFHSLELPIYMIKNRKSAKWLYIFKIRKIIKDEKIKILHCHQRIDSILAWVASFGLNVKIIQTIHDFDYDYGKLNRLIIALSFKIAHRSLFVSKYQNNFYLKNYKSLIKNKSTVVYNGVCFDNSVYPDLTLLKKEYSQSKMCIKLGMVGNFNTVRNQFIICKFLKLLAFQGIDFQFEFVGKKDDCCPQLYDNCYQYCKKNGLSDKVIFSGVRSDISVLLSQLDAFLYSSDHDTFGIAVIEAIASGIPVFVNDWGVLKEITEDGKRVILYRSGDEKDLLKKFMKFYLDPIPFVESSAKNSVWAKNTFNIQNHINILDEIYKGILVDTTF